MNLRLRTSGILLLLLLLAVSGCKKKPVVPPPSVASPPPAFAPTAVLTANPESVERGQSVTLSWNSANATELRLEPGVGPVTPQGSVLVQPERSTTYTLVATGPGGRAEASARVTVNPSSSEPTAVIPLPMEQGFQRIVRDAFFDYDKADIRPDARVALTQTAEFMRQYPSAQILIEGHCDERGSTEYNLGLGDRRANAAREYLTSLGIAASRLQTVSYGKEKPVCSESNEKCWQENRRAHFVLLPESPSATK